ncbi:hypothetical protein HWV62_33905 [Athelia sp. TMB]|nr:hypothetical protein HWV62_33905 [Athelia sp. TMB]
MVAYGITTLQVYMYFTTYFRDSIRLKALVWLVYALDSLHSALVCHVNFYYVVAQEEDNFVQVWSIVASTTVSVITTIVVKCIPYVVTNLSSDMLLAIVMTLCLRTRRSEHEDVFNIIESILAFTPFPSSVYTISVDFLFAKVLANALLVTLNSRYSLKGRATEYSTSEGPTTGPSNTTGPARPRQSHILTFLEEPVEGSSGDDVEQSRDSFALHSSDFAASNASSKNLPQELGQKFNDP